MSAFDIITLFDFAAGSLAALGLAYLLVSDTVVVHYRGFFRTVALGMFAFAATGPVVGEVAPHLVHAVHGLAGLAVTVALYRLVAQSVASGDAFAAPQDADAGFGFDQPADDPATEPADDR